VCVRPAYEALMVTAVEAVTVLVATENVADAALAGTVTLGGTVAAVLLLARKMVAPTAGAAALSMTVPVQAVPATTLAGLSATDVSMGASAAVVLPVASFE